MSVNERLMAIRTIMRSNGLDCCLISSSDCHQSEYIAEYFSFLKYLSGFTGSAGLLTILNDRSVLWTDERYHLQAEKELKSTEIELMIYDSVKVPITQWLCQNLRKGQVVGVDSHLFSLRWFLDAKKKLGVHKINLSDISNLLDSSFKNRPLFPCNPIEPLKKEYTGHTTAEKLATLREKMKELHVQSYLVGSLESIAWICNLRGNDIPYTPVFYAYFILEEKTATLFVQLHALTSESKQSLKSNGVHIIEYAEIEDHFSHMTFGVVYLSPKHINAHICHVLERNNELSMGDDDLTINLKAIKHPAEIASSREAHHQDGSAMVRSLRLISQTWEKGLTEFQITEILESERKKETLFRSLSFRTIVGHTENGAMAHYAPSKKSSKIIRNGLTVLDSGGQFLGATTDITRTFPTGDLTEEECTDYTLTLKTHIALASSLFVSGATGAQLDGIARHTMWSHAINYKHGTGHGIGAMLCVHEGPQSLSGTNLVKFVPGMLISIEPGIYKEKKHGVRIENIYLVIEKLRSTTETFLAFECLTLCPIDTRPLRKELLTEEEIAWLNTYHQKTLKELSPRLSDDDLLYLENTTRPI